jgi:hypothetical protein
MDAWIPLSGSAFNLNLSSGAYARTPLVPAAAAKAVTAAELDALLTRLALHNLATHGKPCSTAIYDAAHADGKDDPLATPNRRTRRMLVARLGMHNWSTSPWSTAARQAASIEECRRIHMEGTPLPRS